MNYYIPGDECDEKFNIVLSLTSIKSKLMIKAMRDHIVVGHSVRYSSWLNDVDVNNLNRALTKFNIKLGKIEEVKQIDWVNKNAT